QPYVEGMPASVVFFVGPQEAIALPPASQKLSVDGRFRYRGGRLPLGAYLANRAVLLARQAIEAVSGLQGYVGVDLVLGSEAVGSRDWLIEINPRPTTSYVGLRALARLNLAQALVSVVEGKRVCELEWHSAQVMFGPDGTFSRSPA